MTDRVDSEGLTIRYCPTDIMLADFFTKALQGNLFRKFKDIILGYLHTKSLLTDMSSSPEERVGKQVKCDSASGPEWASHRRYAGTQVMMQILHDKVVCHGRGTPLISTCSQNSATKNLCIS